MPTSNSTDATVTAYSMSSTGVLARIDSYTTGPQPVALGIDPSTNHFPLTVNYLDGTVSDFKLSTTDGTLPDAQFTPLPHQRSAHGHGGHSAQWQGGGVGSH